MSGGSVRELTQSYSPILVLGEKFHSPPGGDEVGIACRLEEE
jgi:hypothetical protein